MVVQVAAFASERPVQLYVPGAPVVVVAPCHGGYLLRESEVRRAWVWEGVWMLELAEWSVAEGQPTFDPGSLAAPEKRDQSR